jgi:hypothetical protein
VRRRIENSEREFYTQAVSAATEAKGVRSQQAIMCRGMMVGPAKHHVDAYNDCKFNTLHPTLLFSFLGMQEQGHDNFSILLFGSADAAAMIYSVGHFGLREMEMVVKQ